MACTLFCLLTYRIVPLQPLQETSFFFPPSASQVQQPQFELETANGMTSNETSRSTTAQVRREDGNMLFFEWILLLFKGTDGLGYR